MSGSWLKAATADPDAQIVGLADLRIENATARRDEYAPAAAVGTDPAQMFEELRPDVVFNCTIPGAHYAVTRAALLAGANVLTEKPLADSLGEAGELVDLAAARNRIFAVLQNRRYTRAIRHVRHLLESGVIGTLTEASCDFYLGAHFDGFRLEMEHVLLLDMAIHQFDMARFLTGTDAESVTCHEWNPEGSWFRHGACAHALFEMTKGCKFSYRGSWCAEGLQTSWGGSWRFTGTGGSLHWTGDEDGAEGQIVVESLAGSEGFQREVVRCLEMAPSAAQAENGHASVVAEFLHCVRTGTLPETHGADNLKSLAMVLGAVQSATSGRTEAISG